MNQAAETEKYRTLANQYSKEVQQLRHELAELRAHKEDSERRAKRIILNLESQYASAKKANAGQKLLIYSLSLFVHEGKREKGFLETANKHLFELLKGANEDFEFGNLMLKQELSCRRVQEKQLMSLLAASSANMAERDAALIDAQSMIDSLSFESAEYRRTEQQWLSIQGVLTSLSKWSERQFSD